MEQATEKQAFFLKTKGIEAAHLSKQAASEIISSFKGGMPMTQPSLNVPIDKPAYQPKTIKDTSSFYVSYVKDLMVAGIDVDTAIEAIKKAREAL